MTLGRAVLSATLAVSLAACGGGGGNSSGGNTGGGNTGGGGTPGGGGGGGTAACSLADRQNWALGQLSEWYLFPNLLDTSVNQNNYDTVQGYLDALVAPARAQDKDRFFTYITSIEEENDLIQNGSNAGFGVRLTYDTVNNRVFVVEAFENAPAFPKGLDRGTEIVAIGGQSVSSLMASGGPQAVVQALGPSNPGVTRSFTLRQPDGTQRSATVTKTEYSLDPISDRYGVRIFDNDGTRVGYLNLRTFIVDDAKQQLRSAFQRFQSQGVTQVILDLRYNGGGLISVAELLGDLLGANRVGDVYSKTVFRPSKSVNNETTLFMSQPQAISADKIAVIATNGTASASELVTNSFIPYLGDDIGLIGQDTFGKPVGQIALDRSACDDRLRAVALKTTNANNQGEYFSGLASVVRASCAADDDIFTPLGNANEASISTALDYLAGRSCAPITSAAKDGTVHSRKVEREMVMPRQPSAAQFRIPGLN